MKKALLVSFVLLTSIMLVVSGSLIGCKTATSTETTAAETTAAATTAAAETTAVETTAPAAVTDINWIAMSSMTVLPETVDGLAKLGINLKTEENPYEGYREKLLTEWAAGGSSYDIAAVSDEWIADFVTPGYLAKLDDFAKNAPADWNFSDFFQTPIDLVGRYPQGTGNLYTIPFLTFCLELAYNSKMFEDAGIVDENGVAKPPKTVADFEEALKKLTDTGNNKYAFAPLFLAGETVTIQFEHWHRVFTGLDGVLDKNNKPQINTPESIQALDFMKKILDYSPPGALNYRDFEVTQALKNGQVAMIFIWGSFGGNLVDPKDNPNAEFISPVTGTPMPMGAAWGLAIPETAKNKDASWKAIEYMTSKEVAERELTNLPSLFGPGPTRASVFEGDTAKNSPWLVAQGVMLPNTGYRPHLPEWTQISAIISDEVTAALSGQKSSKDALDSAQKKIEDLFK
ncbi:MAG: sugar ABC transporter substrate-binding protein [Actinobacteria bacterium]|nr:sugar ABC transporter substrate-binding protein [Actinomycetota bacterium]